MKLFICDFIHEKILGKMEIEDIEQTKKLIDFLEANDKSPTYTMIRSGVTEKRLAIAESYEYVVDDGYPLLVLKGEDRWRQKNQTRKMKQNKNCPFLGKNKER